ncbi:MAG: hypothetical protein ABIP94_20890 [Planctomycetota bacterium]
MSAPVRDRRFLQLLVLLAVLLQSYRAWGQLQPSLRPLPPADSVSRYWQRFAAVRRQLDRESATGTTAPWQRLGYLGDAPRFEQLPQLGRDEMTGLFLAQHAMLPHLLLFGANEPRILTNFHQDEARRAVLARPDLALERDFGDGVLLLRRQP